MLFYAIGASYMRSRDNLQVRGNPLTRIRESMEDENEHTRAKRGRYLTFGLLYYVLNIPDNCADSPWVWMALTAYPSIDILQF